MTRPIEAELIAGTAPTIEEYREALKPFAACADWCGPDDRSMEIPVTLGDWDKENSIPLMQMGLVEAIDPPAYPGRSKPLPYVQITPAGRAALKEGSRK